MGGFKDAMLGKSASPQSLYQPKYTGLAEQLLMSMAAGTMLKNNPKLGKTMTSDDGKDFLGGIGFAPGTSQTPTTQINKPGGDYGGGASNPYSGLIATNYPNGLPQPKGGFGIKSKKSVYGY